MTALPLALGEPAGSDLVQNDVRRGYYSKEQAEQRFGVVLGEADGTVNEALMRQLRRNMSDG